MNYIWNDKTQRNIETPSDVNVMYLECHNLRMNKVIKIAFDSKPFKERNSSKTWKSFEIFEQFLPRLKKPTSLIKQTLKQTRAGTTWASWTKEKQQKLY